MGNTGEATQSSVLASRSTLSLRSATKDDVKALYLLVLQREPESEAVVSLHTKLNLTDLVRGLFLSDEFLRLIDTAHGQPDFVFFAAATTPEFYDVTTWVRDLLGLDHLQPHGWWDLLHAVVRDPRIQSLFGTNDHTYGTALRQVTDMAAAETERSRYLDTLVEQATDALLSGDPHSDRGMLPPSPRVRKVVERQSHTGSAAARTASRPTPRDVYRSAVAAEIESGATAHWLFDAPFFHRRWHFSLDGEVRRPCHVRARNAAYMNFILLGDESKIDPGPLFSHAAYIKLNKLEGVQRPFLHYVTSGMSQNLPASVIFDQAFYRATYRAVDQAVSSGEYGTELEHFARAGLIQQLDRFSPDFDPDFYRSKYPEIAEAVDSGIFPSLAWHYLHLGRTEGRQVNEFFDPAYYRERYPFVEREMKSLGIISNLEHFLLLGRERGYRPTRERFPGGPPLSPAKSVFERRALRAYANVRAGGFRVPATSEPAISIVVPVVDLPEFTGLFLQCARFAAHWMQNLSRPCEIIIVANGSRPETLHFLRSVDGIRLVESRDKLGFPRAVNLGVSHAAGEYVIVSNNDVEFGPDAFDRITAILRDDPSIGVVGGMTILPNETLQEAGSFLFDDASTMGLGRGEDPWDAMYRGTFDCDYCTGAFFAFRRSDFDRLDGFDDAFSPGYYEETDFALRLRALGKRCVTTSDVQVVHYEHASFLSGRPSQSSYALVKRNQGRLALRHSEFLRGKSTAREVAVVPGGAVRRLSRTRVLVIEDLMPSDQLGSGFGRARKLIKGLLKLGVALDICIVAPNPVIDEFEDVTVRVYRGWMAGEAPTDIVRRYGYRYSHILVCRLHNLARYAGILEECRMTHGTEVICDTEALSALRHVERRRLEGGVVDDEEVIDAVRREMTADVKVSHWIVVNEREALIARRAGRGPISKVGHGLEIGRRQGGGGPGSRSGVLFVGSVHDRLSPNYDSLVWLAKDVLPAIPDAAVLSRIKVVGYWDAETRERFLREVDGSRFDFTGPVDDAALDRLYDAARVCIAPTRFAAGIPLKVLEAMAQGVPIVMTEVLASQLLPERPGETFDFAIADRADMARSFGHHLSELLRDGDRWASIERSQARFVQAVASDAAFMASVAQLVSLVFVGAQHGG